MTPTIEYRNLWDEWEKWDGQFCHYDDQPPLNLSRYFWFMSQQSQCRFEANVLAYGKN